MAEGYSVIATHLETKHPFHVDFYSSSSDELKMLKDLARALEASDKFGMVSVSRSTQESVDWREDG